MEFNIEPPSDIHNDEQASEMIMQYADYTRHAPHTARSETESASRKLMERYYTYRVCKNWARVTE